MGPCLPSGASASPSRRGGRRVKKGERYNPHPPSEKSVRDTVTEQHKWLQCSHHRWGVYHAGMKEELSAGEIADRLLSSAAPGCENIAGRIGLSRDTVNRADLFLYGEPDSAISHSANKRAYKRDLRRAPAKLLVYADWGLYSYETVAYVSGLLRETRAKAMREITSLLAKAKRLGIGISLLQSGSSPIFSHKSAADAVREAVLEVRHTSRWDAGRRLAARLAGMKVPERHAEILMQDYWDQAAHLKPGPYRRSKVIESLRSAYRRFGR